MCMTICKSIVTNHGSILEELPSKNVTNYLLSVSQLTGESLKETKENYIFKGIKLSGT